MSEDILTMIYAAIDEVNAQSSKETGLVKSPDARLLGGDHSVDSLTFVNLIVAIEEQLQNNLGKSVVLVDENSMALQENPFRTIGMLANYVRTLIAQPEPN